MFQYHCQLPILSCLLHELTCCLVVSYFQILSVPGDHFTCFLDNSPSFTILQPSGTLNRLSFCLYKPSFYIGNLCIFLLVYWTWCNLKCLHWYQCIDITSWLCIAQCKKLLQCLVGFIYVTALMNSSSCMGHWLTGGVVCISVGRSVNSDIRDAYETALLA